LNNTPLFHLAFPVNNIEKTKEFYTKVLDCKIGRTSTNWVDFNFFGHQITAHLSENELSYKKYNKVDEKNVPIRHFGLVLDWDVWHKVKNKLILRKVDFLISPYVRFEGEIGEQATLFFLDPSSNAIELKSFKNKDRLFSK